MHLVEVPEHSGTFSFILIFLSIGPLALGCLSSNLGFLIY